MLPNSELNFKFELQEFAKLQYQVEKKDRKSKTKDILVTDGILEVDVTHSLKTANLMKNVSKGLRDIIEKHQEQKKLEKYNQSYQQMANSL